MNCLSCRTALTWLKGRRCGNVLVVICVCLALLMAAGCICGNDCLGRDAALKLLPAFAMFLLFLLFPKIAGTDTTDLICVAIMLWTYYETALGLAQLYGPLKVADSSFAISGSFENPNPYAVMLSVSVCVLESWARRCRGMALKVAACVAVMMSAVLLPSTRCRAAWIAVAVYVSAPLLKTWTRRYSLPALVIGLSLLFGLYKWKQPSADGRLQLWRISCAAITDGKAGGLLGYGPGHFAPAVSAAQTAYFEPILGFDGKVPEISDEAERKCRRAQPVLYAYCDPLQIGVECGLVGMLLFISVSILTIGRLYAAGSPLAGGAIVLSVTGLFMYTLCLWQFFLLNAAFAGVAVRKSEDCRIYRTSAFLRFVPIAICIALFLPHSIVRAGHYKGWRMESYLLDTGDYKTYVRCEEPRSVYLASNPLFMSGYSFALAKASMPIQSDSVAMVALSLTGNPGFLMQLGDNCMDRCEYSQAKEYYRKAFVSMPDRIIPLAKMAKCYVALNDTVGLEKMKAFVSSFHTHVETEMTEALKKELENIGLENE